MTKRILPLLLFIVITLTTFAQKAESEIRETFDTYFDLIEAQDISGTLDFVYPKLFEHYPKADLQTAFEKLYSDPDVKIEMKNAKVKSVSETMEYQGVQYATLDYSFDMHMKFLNNEGGEEGLQFAALMLKEVYGADNVSFDSKTGVISIHTETTMYAVNDPAYPGWKFLEKKEDMKDVMKKIFPKKVLKKL
ncbi:hypothetical protein KFE98_16375 [bacterium SCSIO 12741]|nr:hypothetical protein KFE98_16375 [bacterium SCSIO 12741]